MSILKLFRLTNGDDIIGFLEDVDKEIVAELNGDSDKNVNYDHIVFVRDPLRLIWSYDASTKGHQLFLTRWMPFSDDTFFAIPKDKVVTIADPMMEVEKHYYEISDETFLPGQIEKEQDPQKKQYMEFLKGWDIDPDKEEPH